jgi:hypothetical protein
VIKQTKLWIYHGGLKNMSEPKIVSISTIYNNIYNVRSKYLGEFQDELKKYFGIHWKVPLSRYRLLQEMKNRNIILVCKDYSPSSIDSRVKKIFTKYSEFHFKVRSGNYIYYFGLLDLTISDSEYEEYELFFGKTVVRR